MSADDISELKRLADYRRGHKMLTKKLLRRFEQVGDNDVPDAPVIAKYSHPLMRWTWYATAYYPDRQMFFGLVDGDHYRPELGYFSLDEIGVLGPLGLPWERDLGWSEMPLNELQHKLHLRDQGDYDAASEL